MTVSFTPLLIAGLVVGLLLGLGIGAVGGHVLWATPCPACPIVVCPTPEPCPTTVEVVCPEPPESAFYRGWLASCINNGQLAGAPKETTIKWCRSHLQYGIKGDWFDGFRPDNWSWPPPFLEEGDTQPKSDAGP